MFRRRCATEAAFTASPIPEEEARKALQVPLPVADQTTVIQPEPASSAPQESVPAPAPAPEIPVQPTDTEAPVK